MKRDRLVGLRQLPTSWQAYVTVHGRFISKCFPLDTPIGVMRTWRERTRAEHKYGIEQDAGRTFAEDAADYLGTIGHMPSAKDRRYHIEQWVETIGHLPRSKVTAAVIRQQLASWRVSGRYDGEGLSPASLNRRRTALMAMFTALDGRSAVNVVKDVPAFDERDSVQARAVPMLTLARICRRLPVGSKTRLRAHVLLWTGWPASLLGRVRPDDIDGSYSTVRLSHRRKGHGMASAGIPVLPRAQVALRRLVARNGLGPFSTSAFHKLWRTALAAENQARARRELPPLPHIRPYDIRHSFGTWAASIVKDDRALAALLRTNQIARYTVGSEAQRLQEALQVLQAIRPVQASSGRFAESEAPAKARRNRKKS